MPHTKGTAMAKTYEFNDVEIGTVLAALRYYQDALAGQSAPAARKLIPENIMEIATDDGRFEALDAGDIDDLCEDINCAQEVQ